MIAVEAYQKQLEATFNRIETALEKVDADVLECERSSGGLTLVIQQKIRSILSAQPSLQELWLAMASEGRAYHFRLTEEGTWLDTKQDLELLGLLKEYFQKKLNLSLEF
jgi:iron donor protein CyaY